MRHSSHLHLHFHTHHRAARYDVDMTKGSITKHLINFALPLMVGNLFQQLYNMVDTWVVGNYVSNEAFSAVGTVTPIILSIKDAVQAGIVGAEVPMYLVGVAVAAVTGYLCIRLLKYIADKGRFGAFAYYCWAAGVLTLVLQGIK